MKIALSSTGTDLQSEIDPRFGRCANFIIVDPDSLEATAIENQNLNLQGGAGVQTAEHLLSHNVGAVITGNIGPNAMAVLKAAGVSVYTGVSGTVEQAVNDYKAGKLKHVTGQTSTANTNIGRKRRHGRACNRT